MIYAELAHVEHYAGPSPRLTQALTWLRTADLGRLSLGTLELDGPALHVRVAEYVTRPAVAVPFEAHRRFIDVQCLAAGCEQLGFAPVAALRMTQAYDAERDIALFAPPTADRPPGGALTLVPGRFAILFPHDAHQPGVAVGPPCLVRKVVLKVALPA